MENAYPRRKKSIVVFLIIAINMVVYSAWVFSRSSLEAEEFMAANFLVSWETLVDGRYWTLITSVFSHNLVWHLALNMYVLLSFGAFMEIVLGRMKFLKFYLVAGIVSSLSHAVLSRFLIHQPDLPALGASGAVAGVIVLFSLMFPRERILLLGFVPIPAFFGALAFVGLDLWGLWAQAGGGGLPIGHGAHLGGALAGVIYHLKTGPLACGYRYEKKD